MTWRPPTGWSVIVLRKRKTCTRCQRRLPVGEPNLYRHRPNLKRAKMRHQFACIDRTDCDAVRAWGGEPTFRKRLTEYAAQLDRAAGRS